MFKNAVILLSCVATVWLANDLSIRKIQSLEARLAEAENDIEYVHEFSHGVWESTERGFNKQQEWMVSLWKFDRDRRTEWMWRCAEWGELSQESAQ